MVMNARCVKNHTEIAR